jgi:hypothetical protein
MRQRRWGLHQVPSGLLINEQGLTFRRPGSDGACSFWGRPGDDRLKAERNYEPVGTEPRWKRVMSRLS